MFGLVIPSRPFVPFISVSPTSFAATFPKSPSFSHLVVFLLPGNELPANTAAAVYISFTGASGEFKLLGALGLEKQSAVFKVKALSGARVDEAPGLDVPEVDMDADDSTGTVTVQEITLGISFEPAEGMIAQLAAPRVEVANEDTPSTALVSTIQPLSTKVLAQRIILNAFNYLSSFAGADSADMVPMKSLQDWWTKFERRIEVDPGFLERDGD